METKYVVGLVNPFGTILHSQRKQGCANMHLVILEHPNRSGISGEFQKHMRGYSSGWKKHKVRGVAGVGIFMGSGRFRLGVKCPTSLNQLRECGNISIHIGCFVKYFCLLSCLDWESWRRRRVERRPKQATFIWNHLSWVQSHTRGSTVPNVRCLFRYKMFGQAHAGCFNFWKRCCSGLIMVELHISRQLIVMLQRPSHASAKKLNISEQHRRPRRFPWFEQRHTHDLTPLSPWQKWGQSSLFWDHI